jgi:DNA-binding beta-propeller fold protein YncE
LLFLGGTWIAYADGFKATIIRNDSLPLQMDQEIGRFGTGKLYFDDPADLIVDEDLNVYILDAGNNRIQIMDDRGFFESKWGSRGKSESEFDEPIAMAVDPDFDFIVVLDGGDSRVKKFDMEGNFMLAFGEEGTRKGLFREPVDLTVDNFGYIYIVDREHRTVKKFHREGSFIKEWGRRGRPEELLEEPISVAFSDELTGYIYVLDVGKQALIKFDRDGDYDKTIPLPESLIREGFRPVRVAVDPENNVFVLDAGLGKLISLQRYGITVFQLRQENVPLEQPSGLTIDEDGQIYVSDLKKNRVYRFPLELN